jgi:threonine dehydrogenase-like Zn-dependent dehydrogenase
MAGRVRPDRRDIAAPVAVVPFATTTAGEVLYGYKPGNTYDVAVIGAGVFGSWTAHHLQKAGKKVILIDGYGAASARAPRCGVESRPPSDRKTWSTSPYKSVNKHRLWL